MSKTPNNRPFASRSAMRRLRGDFHCLPDSDRTIEKSVNAVIYPASADHRTASERLTNRRWAQLPPYAGEINPVKRAPEAIRRSIDFGVRSIEHGNLIDRATAEHVAGADAFVVPTLATYDALHRHGRELGFPEVSMAKRAEVREAGLGSLEILQRAGVKIGYGTDLLGPMHRARICDPCRGDGALRHHALGDDRQRRAVAAGGRARRCRTWRARRFDRRRRRPARRYFTA
jgi:hypothetical protein